MNMTMIGGATLEPQEPAQQITVSAGVLIVPNLRPDEQVRRISDDLYLVRRDVIFQTAQDAEYIGRRFRSFFNDEVQNNER